MRRGQFTAVMSCLAGAGLTLFAVTRVWVVEVEQRPGLPDLRTEQLGSAVQPWLTGLAVMALAGAGALLATRGVTRRVLGGLLVLTGAGIAVGAILARAGVDPGAAGAAGTVWPVVSVLGGAAVAAGGVLAARHGHRWAAMSSRYDRSPAPSSEAPAPAPSALSALSESPPADPAVTNAGAPDNRAFWDALDRGEDPTAR